MLRLGYPGGVGLAIFVQDEFDVDGLGDGHHRACAAPSLFGFVRQSEFDAGSVGVHVWMIRRQGRKVRQCNPFCGLRAGAPVGLSVEVIRRPTQRRPGRGFGRDRR